MNVSVVSQFPESHLNPRSSARENVLLPDTPSPGQVVTPSSDTKNSSSVAQVVVGLPVPGPFDYAIPKGWAGRVAVGMRVKVPFGPRRLVGYVIGLSNESTFKNLKSAEAMLDTIPVLDERLLRLTQRIADLYGCSWGEAIEAALPTALRKAKSYDALSVDILRPASKSSKVSELLLLHDPNHHQAFTWLLTKIKAVLAAGESVIYLAPEASLLDETIAVVKKENILLVVFDKKVSVKKELENWIAVKSGNPVLILGTRSAIFAPCPRLGLIVMTDEENSAYKQEQTPYYHTRDLVLLRANAEGASAAFTSAAPSAEIWFGIAQKKVQYVAFTATPTSEWQLIDLNNYNPRKSSILSVPLRNDLQKVLDSQGRMLLWFNRKGFASFTRCGQCGFSLKCDRCDVNMTYFYSKRKLVCRRCGKTAPLPTVCPQCKKSYLLSTGLGAEKLESEISRWYPQARVEHYDRESPRLPPSFNILIATQAVMKTIEVARFEVVAVLEIDSELNRMDFRSTQRAFSLLTRLRFAARKKLIVQTKLPDNYGLINAASGDFENFYREELKLRRELDFPPFSSLISISVRSLKEQSAFEQAQLIYDMLLEQLVEGIDVMEPHPDVVPKLRDKYRFTVMLRGRKIEEMLALIKKVLGTRARKSKTVVTINPDYSPEVFWESS